MTGLPEKIAYFIDARAWGGAEVYLMQLVAAARDAGIEPHVYCADRHDADAWIEALIEQGFNVTRYRPTKEFNPLGFFAARRVLRGYDVVHINKTHPRNSLPAVVAARHSGASVVVATEHLTLRPDSRFPMGRRIITFLVRCTNRLLDKTIAVSELSRDQLIDHYGIPPERIVAIRNGMDVARFDEDVDASAVRAELGFEDDDSIALLIGRFAPLKGHTFALRALASAMERVPGLKMVFAGNGELEEELKAEAGELGLADRVLFAGFRRDVPRLLAASDVLILPSESESLPLVILEAMAARRPVVSTDVGGISEAVEDGRTGLLVKPRDSAGLADAMVEVLGDVERGRSMGLEGRRKLEAEFSLDACAAAVFEVYDELLSRGDRGQ